MYASELNLALGCKRCGRRDYATPSPSSCAREYMPNFCSARARWEIAFFCDAFISVYLQNYGRQSLRTRLRTGPTENAA